MHHWGEIEEFLEEDGCLIGSEDELPLPLDTVKCHLKIKSPLRLAGMPWFIRVFECLGANKSFGIELMEKEGKDFRQGDEITFKLPFAYALKGERVALNLLTRASSIATYTTKFVATAIPSKIAILDTRKTTPGLRVLEKYAVRVGGGQNHRTGQRDVWIIKDNHKSFFGGVVAALKFFDQAASFYTPLVVEIDSLGELEEVLALKNPAVKHLMLDNFSPQDLPRALELKPPTVTYEVSGGITLANIASYALDGIDAISIGSLTSFPPAVDMSLKYGNNRILEKS